MLDAQPITTFHVGTRRIRPAPCVGFDNRVAGVRIARHLSSWATARLAMISGIPRQ